MQTPPLTININGCINNRLVIEFINIAHKQEGWYKLIRLNESENVSASIEIDGFKSKSVVTPKALGELLLTH